MNQVSEIHLHLHVHEGADPEAVRVAAEALRGELANSSSEGLDRGDGKPDEDRTRELVQRAYIDSVEKAKPLLDYLADNPDRLIPYPEMSSKLGFTSSRSLPGLLGAFSRRADHRYGGAQPFERRDTLEGWCLYMPKENAEIIDDLRR